MAMDDRVAPCPCGSVIHKDLHLISSTRLSPVRGSGHVPAALRHLYTFLKTAAYEFREDPREVRALWSFVPDLYFRWLTHDLLSKLQRVNMRTWRRLTEEGGNEQVTMDPETVK